MSDSAVRRLKPWDQDVGLDSSITNVAKGKRAINRGLDKLTSQLPLPTTSNCNATFYASGHEAGHNKKDALPRVDSSRGVYIAFRQCLAGEDKRGGPKVTFTRPDSHKVREALIDGTQRRLAREKIRAADMADELLLERVQMEQRHTALTELEFARLAERAKKLGIAATKRPPVRLPAEDKKTFQRTLRDPDVMKLPMQRWAPENKVLW